ncbi:hypothetical protein QTP86_012509 [Hemibagrus guttatus]|nr:hypothetical protein QTP86_012509 [Hemibagrus guttatus]
MDLLRNLSRERGDQQIKRADSGVLSQQILEVSILTLIPAALKSIFSAELHIIMQSNPSHSRNTSGSGQLHFWTLLKLDLIIVVQLLVHCQMMGNVSQTRIRMGASALRVKIQTLMLAYKAKNGPAPSYLKALVTPRTAPRSLRSTSTARLVPPSLREKAA